MKPPCPHARARDGKRRGFTFAEVLVAMVFMSIVIPIAVQGVLTASRAGSVAEKKRVAAQLASNLLTELVITEDWTDGETEGYFDEEYGDYAWEIGTETWEEDNLSTADPMVLLTVWVSYQVQGNLYDVHLSTLVEDPEAEEAAEEEEVVEEGMEG